MYFISAVFISGYTFNLENYWLFVFKSFFIG